MRYTQIETLVYKMLTENTGINMMDSGGDEGRGWQRNQKKTIDDFKNGTIVDIDYNFKEWKDGKYADVENISSSEAPIYVSLFHYMTSGILELDDLCNEFNKKKVNNWDSGIYGVSDKGEKWVDSHFKVGDSWNSYNGEETISQTVQGTNLYYKGNESHLEYPDYVLLQIHNGADVRGGYTDAKLFKVIEGGYFTSTPEIHGTIDDVEVDTTYNGIYLTDTEGNAVTIKKDSKINLYLTEY